MAALGREQQARGRAALQQLQRGAALRTPRHLPLSMCVCVWCSLGPHTDHCQPPDEHPHRSSAVQMAADPLYTDYFGKLTEKSSTNLTLSIPAAFSTLSTAVGKGALNVVLSGTLRCLQLRNFLGQFPLSSN